MCRDGSARTTACGQCRRALARLSVCIGHTAAMFRHEFPNDPGWSGYLRSASVSHMRERSAPDAPEVLSGLP